MSIPGQPVSLDAMYRTGQVWITDRTGAQRQIRRPIITDEAVRWRDDVTVLVRTAKPSKWPRDLKTQIRITIDLFLASDLDADNCLKGLLDGVSAAIEMNDMLFLPCVRSKVSGLPLRDAHVDLMLDTDLMRGEP